MKIQNIKINKIVRSKRKTIALKIGSGALLTVYAPQHVTDNYILWLVQKKKQWIYEKRSVIIRKIHNTPPKEYVNGEGFWYLGKQYKLEFVNNGQGVKFNNKFLIPKKQKRDSKPLLINWYKDRSLKKATERLAKYSAKLGSKPHLIKITNANQRWGSCSDKGTLNFSWRLSMLPLIAIDYIIVHELCHLEVKNHSKKFWNKVYSLMSDHQKRKSWLKKNEHLFYV